MNYMSFLPSRHECENKLKKWELCPCKAFHSQERVSSHLSGDALLLAAVGLDLGRPFTAISLGSGSRASLGWADTTTRVEHPWFREAQRATGWDCNEPVMTLGIRLVSNT